MSPATAVPLIAVVVVLAVDWWVYTDATAHEERGTHVIFSVGSFVLDSPASWFLGCLLLGSSSSPST